MLSQVTWYLENHVLFAQFPEIVTLEVALDYSHQTLAYLHSTPAPRLHTISDLSRVKQLPSIPEGRKIAALLSQERMGWNVGYESNHPLFKMLMQVISHMRPVHFHFADSLNEALIVLNRIDPTLPDLRPFKHTIPAYQAAVQ